MEVFTGIRVLSAVIIVGSIVALVRWAAELRARKKSRLEMKRHVNAIETHGQFMLERQGR